MKSFGYYSFADTRGTNLNGCSKESGDRPFVVNCAGCFSTGVPFMTDNREGRLDYYLMYITAGTLTFFDDERIIEAAEENVIIFPAKMRYKYTYAGGGELDYLWVHFTGSEAESRLAEYSLEFFPVIHKASSANHIPQRFQGIFDAFQKQDRYRDRELSALLERLLVDVARSVKREGDGENSLSRSMRHIVANYSSDIRIPYLASMEHLSTSRYNFLFKKRMGMSPKRYILQLRMSAAGELLISTDLPIKEIGLMCGYNDPHFFSKTFKGYFGVSPVAYKQGIRVE